VELNQYRNTEHLSYFEMIVDISSSIS